MFASFGLVTLFFVMSAQYGDERNILFFG